MRRAGWRYVLLLGWLTAGCAAPRIPRMAVPAPQITQTHFLGSAVSGPESGTLGADAAANAIVVQVRLYAATEIDNSKLEPIGAAARLVLASGDRQPVLATGALTSAMRWAKAANADALATQLEIAPPRQVARFQDERFAIPSGVSAALVATDVENHRELRVLVSNPPDKSGAPTCEIALGVTSEAGQREQAVLEPMSVADGVSVALVIPFTFSDSTSRYVAALIQAKPAPAQLNDDMVQLLDRCRQDVQHESTAAEQRLKERVSTQLLSGNWPGFEAALSSAGDPKTRRASLVYLASQTGATLSRDAFLVADESTLAKMLDEVAARMASVAPADRSDAALAWLLDLSTLEFMGKLLSDNQLPPELSAVLTDYAGEAGRHSASIDQITKKLANRTELQARLVAENTIYLEDGSTAARVRAYDWLKSRGKAPAGYDPLGAARQRRDALQKVNAAATQ